MILNLVIKFLLYFCVIATLLTFLPGWILLDIKPRGFKVHAPKNLNAYTPIETVKIAHYEAYDDIRGPESIALFQDRAVTGSADGYLYEIVGEKDSHEVSFKRLIRVIDEPGCMKKHGAFSSICGHPLGMKFDSKGDLFVVEPSRSVYKVSGLFTPTPKVSKVLDIDRTTSKFLDDIAVLEKPSGNHILYLTDVSKKFTLEQAMLPIFASELGQVISYDMETKTVKTIVDSLLFPNGIEVTPSGDAVFFAEFTNRSIHKYHLSGPKKGTDQVLLSDLPAEIDNVRLSASGKSLWLAMLRPTTLFAPTEMDYYLKKPLLRKLIARASYHIGQSIEFVSRVVFSHKNEYLREMATNIKHLYWMFPTLIDHRGGMMLEIDFNGKVLSSVYSQNDTRIGQLSEVREIKSQNAAERTFYLGSFSAGYIRKLVIKK